MVTRYFGGIKLGTGGLVRAYTQSAKLGIEAAGVREVCERFFAVTEIDYKYYDAFQKMEEKGGFNIEQSDYADKITITISTESEKEEQLKGLINEITQGGGKIIKEYKKNT